jgi:hypothetical protein
MGPAEGAEAALAAAAAASGDWRAADAAADQEKRLQFRQVYCTLAMSCTLAAAVRVVDC